MGVDVEMMVRTAEPLTDAELADLDAACVAEFGLDYAADHRLSRCKYEGDGCIIEFDSLDRFYGVGYERGPWERIRAHGDWLAVRFGETAEVRYGGDSSAGWDWLTPWPIVRAENEAHWKQVGHHPYWPHRNNGCSCDHCKTTPWPSPAASGGPGALRLDVDPEPDVIAQVVHADDRSLEDLAVPGNGPRVALTRHPVEELSLREDEAHTDLAHGRNGMGEGRP